jgi:hypothetical protein
MYMNLRHCHFDDCSKIADERMIRKVWTLTKVQRTMPEKWKQKTHSMNVKAPL